MRKTFRDQIKEIVKIRYGGKTPKAALEIGIENSTLWRYLNESNRTIDLRTFACLCTWAKIDANSVIDEFTI